MMFYGNILISEDYSMKYRQYPVKDFSKVKWSKVTLGVDISKFNMVDSTTLINDSSIVVFHYQCYLANGEMIDNSFVNDNPSRMPLNQLIKGFGEGIKRMQPNETAFIKIQPHMAYGDKTEGNVPANSTLIYFVELLYVLTPPK